MEGFDAGFVVQNREPCGERSSIAWLYFRWGVLLLCGLLCASSVLYALVWLLQWLFGVLKGVRHISVRLVPLLAIISLVIGFFSSIKALDLAR